tara:strand:- start:2 stop:268 length:267 start_codon:yes stop_codon:yes gene_type:complete
MEQVYNIIGMVIFWLGGIIGFLFAVIFLLDKCFEYIKVFKTFMEYSKEYFFNKEEFLEWRKSKNPKEVECICNSNETGWCEVHHMDTL